MRRYRALPLAAGLFLALVASTANSHGEKEPANPTTMSLSGLPTTEGRQLFVGDEAGNAYVVQLAEKRVFEIDESGQARFLLELESETPISGAFRAAVGDEGRTWIFGFAPHAVRIFLNGEDAQVEPPGPVVTGMTVSGGRPVLSLAAIVPDVGTDVGKERALPEVPPLAVRLESDGEWQTWIEREDIDRFGETIMTMGITGFETRLAGSSQGRLLYARRYRYDVREYKKSGTMADRLEYGEVEMVPLPDDVVERLEEVGRKVDRSRQRPKSLIEGVAWSPEGDVLILATAEGGYVLDQWVPALQEHQRLSLDVLDDATRLQMVAGRNGLLFLPALDSSRLYFVPWEYLREADWQSLADPVAEAEPAG